MHALTESPVKLVVIIEAVSDEIKLHAALP